MSRHNPATHSHRFAFDGTVLERVLLAIIEAHTTQTTQGRQYERLNTAMNALTGDVRPSEQDTAITTALEWMARERRREACNHDMRALSAGANNTPPRRQPVRELAGIAAYEFLACRSFDDLSAATDKLCEAFPKMQHTDALDFDPARDAMQTQSVARICAELAEWDIPSRL